jgi:cell wall-associated NlpC family hydrolase
MMNFSKYLSIILVLSSCEYLHNNVSYNNSDTTTHDSIIPVVVEDTIPISTGPLQEIKKEDVDIQMANPTELVEFAKTLIGVPYLYASTDPSKGFDCSGFITYVFNHFKIAVPRSSVDFTNVGKEVATQNAKAGDLILFTGTIDSIRIVGHMGIVTENSDTLKFIHSTSGRAYGVTVSRLDAHYKKRFVKVIRVFPE